MNSVNFQNSGSPVCRAHIQGVLLLRCQGGLAHLTDDKIRETSEAATKQLEEIRDNIQQRYNKLSEFKSANEQDLEEMDKNIY